MSKFSSLSELSNFVSKSANSRAASAPKKDIAAQSGFWQAYKTASATSVKRSQPAKVSDLLGAVMAISARTRRIIAPKTHIELDVFTPSGKRAVHLIMGTYF